MTVKEIIEKWKDAGAQARADILWGFSDETGEKRFDALIAHIEKLEADSGGLVSHAEKMEAENARLQAIVDKWGGYLDLLCGEGSLRRGVSTAELLQRWNAIRDAAQAAKENNDE